MPDASTLTVLRFLWVLDLLRLSLRGSCTGQILIVVRAVGEASLDVVGQDFGYGWAHWVITHLYQCHESALFIRQIVLWSASSLIVIPGERDEIVSIRIMDVRRGIRGIY